MRRWLFLGVALPHVAMSGIALGLLVSGMMSHTWNSFHIHSDLLIFAGSFILTLSALIILALLEDKKGIKEARIGAVYALAFAFSLLFISKNPWSQAIIMERFRGDIITVASNELIISFLIYTFTAGCLIIFKREFLLISFDSDLAKIMGKNVSFWNLFLYLLVGLVIANGVVLTGPLVVFSLMVFPGATARVVVCGMNNVLFLSSVLGITGASMGFIVSINPAFDSPLGPTISVVTALVCAVIILIFKVYKSFLKYFCLRKSCE